MGKRWQLFLLKIEVVTACLVFYSPNTSSASSSPEMKASSTR